MPIDKVVEQGDCISSIADEHGFFWETLWNLPENSDLKQERKEPTILHEGDVVHIPDLRAKTEDCATEQKHKFKRKGVPAMLKMRILRSPQSDATENTVEPPDTDQDVVTHEDPEPVAAPADEPWTDADYTIDIDGKFTRGKTDGDGKLEISIPPGARSGMLTMEPGSPHERKFPLALGHLDPVTTIPGVADRLNHLGYGDGTRPEEMTPGLAAAINSFQRANGIQATGEADEATQNKLKEMHGS